MPCSAAQLGGINYNIHAIPATPLRLRLHFRPPVKSQSMSRPQLQLPTHCGSVLAWTDHSLQPPFKFQTSCPTVPNPFTLFLSLPSPPLTLSQHQESFNESAAKVSNIKLNEEASQGWFHFRINWLILLQSRNSAARSKTSLQCSNTISSATAALLALFLLPSLESGAACLVDYFSWCGCFCNHLSLLQTSSLPIRLSFHLALCKKLSQKLAMTCMSQMFSAVSYTDMTQANWKCREYIGWHA